MSEYTRYLILGTIERERYLNDAYRYGWISQPSLLDVLKQKLCRHDFTLWCTNQGVEDVRSAKCRQCKKCGYYEEVAE